MDVCNIYIGKWKGPPKHTLKATFTRWATELSLGRPYVSNQGH